MMTAAFSIGVCRSRSSTRPLMRPGPSGMATRGRRYVNPGRHHAAEVRSTLRGGGRRAGSHEDDQDGGAGHTAKA